MKVIFWEDNAPVLEMFSEVAKELTKECEPQLINYSGVGSTYGILKLIDILSPDVMVVAREETCPIEHAIATSGIPTLLIPHGALMCDEARLWFGDGERTRVRHGWVLMKQAYWKLRKHRKPLWSLLVTGLFRLRNDFREPNILSRYDNYSKIAAYGNAMKDILVKYKVNPENIVITGSPKYDKYANLAHDGNGKILLITDYLVEFGLWSPKQRQSYLQDVCNVVNRLSSGELRISIHPVQESLSDYNNMISKEGLSAVVYQMRLFELIKECDIVITLLSMSGLEAMVAGRPLVIYNPYGNYTPYNGNSGAYVAHSWEELFNTVSKLLHFGIDEQHAKLAGEYIYEQTYEHDGKAAKRIAQIIMELGNASR